MKEIAVIMPALSLSGLHAFRELERALGQESVDFALVTNGRTVEAAATRELTESQVVSKHENLGFGRSINFAAHKFSSHAWIVIVNDDVHVEEADLLGHLRRIASTSPSPEIVYLVDETARTIPGLREVVTNLSLIGVSSSRLRRKTRGSSPTDTLPSTDYASFSFVAIRKDLWQTLSGFDEKLPFTYEDADFVRRAYELGARAIIAPLPGARHEGSRTTSSYVDIVLPVTAWSAVKYLEKWTKSVPLSRVVVIAAMIMRIPLVLFSRANRRKHLIGILTSVRAVWICAEPELPNYQEF